MLHPVSDSPSTRSPFGADWRDVPPSDHFVQFYDSESDLIDSLGGFFAAGLRKGESAVMIGTREHRAAIDRRLGAEGLDLAALRASGQFQELDAADALSEFMAGRVPDQRRFDELMTGVLTRAGRGGRGVRAFGEMVSLLWAKGERGAAIRLEQLWNDLAKVHTFALYCAYPRACLAADQGDAHLHSICEQHSRVIPSARPTGEVVSVPAGVRV